MKKLTEESVLAYFSRNKHITIMLEEKFIFLDSILINKDSIMKRLCYLTNIHNWNFSFKTFNI